MTVTWKSTYDRFKSAQRAHIFATPALAAKFALYFLCLPGAALVAIVIVVHDAWAGHHISESEFVIPIALAGGAIGGWVSRVLTMRKLYRNSWPSKAKVRENVLTFTGDGVSAECAGVGKTQLEWNAFCRFVESRQWILIYFSKTRWLNIPRESLTQDQYSELMQYLKAHVGGEGSC
jgi:YcxB-like protein